MIQYIAKFLIARLSSADMIGLGEALVAAGDAAKARQQAIDDALSHIRVGVTALTK